MQTDCRSEQIAANKFSINHKLIRNLVTHYFVLQWHSQGVAFVCQN